MLHDTSGNGRGLVVFVPGAWVHSRSWAVWQEHFDRNGYDSLVSGWPGENGSAERRRRPRATTRVSLRTLVEGLDGLLTDAEPGPILVGHGIGAVVVQMLLYRGYSAGAAIAIAPPSVGWVRRSAAVGHLATKLRWGAADFRRPGTLSLRSFTVSYANACPPDEAADLYRRYVITSTIWPLVRASATWRDPAGHARSAGRAPLLLISGGRDRLCPERAVQGWERFGRRHFPDDVTDHHVFPRRGHSLTFDAGWEAVADYCLDWLSAHDV